MKKWKARTSFASPGNPHSTGFRLLGTTETIPISAPRSFSAFACHSRQQRLQGCKGNMTPTILLRIITTNKSVIFWCGLFWPKSQIDRKQPPRRWYSNQKKREHQKNKMRAPVYLNKHAARTRRSCAVGYTKAIDSTYSLAGCIKINTVAKSKAGRIRKLAGCR